MTKYRKKPVVIDTVQWKGTNMSEIRQLMCPDVVCVNDVPTLPNMRDWQPFIINTLEGDMTAQLGDFIIKGVQGEFYPCKPDIFAATYEEVK